MRIDRRVMVLVVGAALAAMGLVGCATAPPEPPEPVGGKCCIYTGPMPHDCAAIEALGPGADLDGRCNQVNQGQSCAWDYSVAECCEIAANDGFGDPVTCEPGGKDGKCCLFTGPVAHDCAGIESLPAGADFDGRCNQVNQGQSCSWSYATEECCKVAVDDGFPGSVVCN